MSFLCAPTTVSDLDIVFAFFEASILYQEKNGHISWRNFDREAVRKDALEGNQYKITSDGEIAIVFSVCYSDPLIWREREKGDSIYLHRIVINPRFKGQQMFGKVLEWSLEHARSKGLSYVRMDTWADNASIIRYYQTFGFRLVETYTTPDSDQLPVHNRQLRLALLEMDSSGTMYESRIILENFIQHASRPALSTPGMKVMRSATTVFVDSGIPNDTFNIMFITDGHSVRQRDVWHALSYFRWKRYPYCIWVEGNQFTENLRDVFKALGIRRRTVAPEPGMIFDLDLYQPLRDEKHSAVRVAATISEIEDFGNVIASLFTPPDENIMDYYRQVAPAIIRTDSGVELLFYKRGEVVIGVVEMFASDRDTMGIYGLVTHAAARGNGIGTALMTYALNRAKEKGYRRVVLQASEDGVRMYRKLGFRDVTNFQEFS